MSVVRVLPDESCKIYEPLMLDTMDIEAMLLCIHYITACIIHCCAGFCGETEEEHEDTVSLMQQTGFDQAFMFAYSEREKTHAAKHLQDDVPADVKSRRLQEIIATFRDGQLKQNEAEVGKIHLVRLPAGWLAECT